MDWGTGKNSSKKIRNNMEKRDVVMLAKSGRVTRSALLFSTRMSPNVTKGENIFIR
jgi:hypothetical protein